MRLLLYEKMVRIKRDAEWSVALGKAVERLDLGVGFKNSDLDSGMDTLVREIEKKIRGNMEQPNPCGHLEAEIVQSKEANHVLSQRILELESARAVAIERAEKAEACEQLLCDHINSLSREVARMHDALARDFALMVKLSCNRDQLSAAEQERDLALERVKALEDAMKSVEWINHGGNWLCPWCFRTNLIGDGHAKYCKRQLALSPKVVGPKIEEPKAE
jgi:hypothetical protein